MRAGGRGEIEEGVLDGERFVERGEYPHTAELICDGFRARLVEVVHARDLIARLAPGREMRVGYDRAGAYGDDRAWA